MKRLVVFTALITILTISQARMIQTGNEHYGKPTATVVQRQTATRNVLVRAKIQKPKIFASKPFRYFEDFEDDNDADDIITSYRRRDLNKIEHEDGISERVRWRLFLARQLAMLKYKEIHS